MFTGPDGPLEVEITGAFRSNNSMIVRQAATSGYGIALLGDPLTINDIRAGRLYRLLPNYTASRRRSLLSTRRAATWRSGPALSLTSLSMRFAIWSAAA